MDKTERPEKNVELTNLGLTLSFIKNIDESFSMQITEKEGIQRWKGKFDLISLKEDNTSWGYFHNNKRLSTCIENIFDNNLFNIEKSGVNYLLNFVSSFRIMNEEDTIRFTLLLKKEEIGYFEKKVISLSLNMLKMEKTNEEKYKEFNSSITLMKDKHEVQINKLNTCILKIEESNMKNQKELIKTFDEMKQKNEKPVKKLFKKILKLTNSINLSQKNQSDILNEKLDNIESKLEDFVKKEEHAQEIEQLREVMQIRKTEEFAKLNEKIDHLLKQKEMFLATLKEGLNQFEDFHKIDNKNSIEMIDCQTLKGHFFSSSKNLSFTNFNKTVEKVVYYSGFDEIDIDVKIPIKGRFSIKFRVDFVNSFYMGIGIAYGQGQRRKNYYYTLRDGKLRLGREVLYENNNPNVKNGDLITLQIDLDQKEIFLYNNEIICANNNKINFSDNEWINLKLYVGLEFRDKLSLID
jgi:hypothetical protein